jgi:NAD(P)H-hydrate epimerase
MAGAPALAAKAALRSGAGLVRVATSSTVVDTVAGFEPCYTTISLPADDNGRILASAASLAEVIDSNDVLALGPGLGRSAALDALVATLWADVPQPALFDADALNALAAFSKSLPQPAGPRVLTPHPGEWQRITGIAAADRAAQCAAAVRWAAKQRCVVVLKGWQTFVTDGAVAYENTTGNPGMATGGTGDVLTGIIAALLGQSLDPLAAARLGVWAHGRAGDLAAAAVGETALIATDLTTHLPAVWQELSDKA